MRLFYSYSLYYIVGVELFAGKVAVPTMVGSVARAGSATEVCMLDYVIGRMLPAHEPDAGVRGAPNAHGTQADERR